MTRSTLEHAIGVKFEVDGAEYVATEYLPGTTNVAYACKICAFDNKQTCATSVCNNGERADKTEVYFLTLQDYLTKRIKGNI